jgi:hypothetical protein
MSEPRASDRNVDRVIRSWLHEDRHEDVSRVAGAVLDLLDTIPQRRSPWWPARRFPFMHKFVSLGLGAAAVVVALVIGTQVLGPSAPGGVGGAPSASPSPTPAPTATTEPSPSPIAAPPLTQTFTSQMHGISVSYPEGWIARAATEPWTDRPGVPQFLHPGFDVLHDPVQAETLFLDITSQPIGDSTPEEWVAANMAGWGCSTTEPIAVDGATGLIGADCRFAFVTTAGRGYGIQLYASGDDFSQDPSAPYDRAWFEEVLATVQLQPEDAVDVAPSASP